MTHYNTKKTAHNFRCEPFLHHILHCSPQVLEGIIKQSYPSLPSEHQDYTVKGPHMINSSCHLVVICLTIVSYILVASYKVGLVLTILILHPKLYRDYGSIPAVLAYNVNLVVLFNYSTHNIHLTCIL